MEPILDLNEASDLDLQACQGKCTAEPLCKYLLFLEKAPNNKRCVLFERCDEQLVYEDGNPDIYEKGNTFSFMLNTITKTKFFVKKN